MSEQHREMTLFNQQLADDVQQQRLRAAELEDERAKQAALMEFKRQQLELESARQRQEMEQQRQKMAQQLLEFEKQRQGMERQRLELETQQKLIAAQQLQQQLKKEEEEEQRRRQQQLAEEQRRLEEQERRRQQQLAEEQQQLAEKQQQTPDPLQGLMNRDEGNLAHLEREIESLGNRLVRCNHKISLASSNDELMRLRLEASQIQSAIDKRNVLLSRVKKEIADLKIRIGIRRGSGRGKNIVSPVFSDFIVFNYSSSSLLGELRG